MIVSAFLPWWKASGNLEGLDWPLNFLWEGKASATGPVSVGVVMILLGLLAFLLTFAPFAKMPRRLVGLAAVAVAVLFVRALVAARSGLDLGDALTHQVEYGLWVALGGGVALLL